MKIQKYQLIYKQVQSLLEDETDLIAVLDIDSEHLATFDETDKIWLEKIVALLRS